MLLYVSFSELQDQVKDLTADLGQVREEKKTLEEKNSQFQQELSDLGSTLDSLKSQLEEQTKVGTSV